MSKESAKKFLEDSKENKVLQKAINVLKDESLSVFQLSKELGYDFTPSEFGEAFIEFIFE